jgi:hypothetical protein
MSQPPANPQAQRPESGLHKLKLLVFQIFNAIVKNDANITTAL